MNATVFKSRITTSLNYYKNIVRKNLAPQDAEEKIKQLKLKRQQLRSSNDLSLYQTTQNVIDTIEQEIATKQVNPSWHFGIANFMQHLQSTLDEYTVENNKIVHSKQNASRAIVNAIQLISVSSDKMTTSHKNKLDKCVQTVAKYGAKEQQKMLRDIFNKRMEHNVNLFDTMLQKLKLYISTASDSWATV